MGVWLWKQPCWVLGSSSLVGLPLYFFYFAKLAEKQIEICRC